LPSAYLIDAARSGLVPQPPDREALEGALAACFAAVAPPARRAEAGWIVVGGPGLDAGLAQGAALQAGLAGAGRVALPRPGGGADLALAVAVHALSSGFEEVAVVAGVGGQRPADAAPAWSAGARQRYTPVGAADLARFAVRRAGIEPDDLEPLRERREACPWPLPVVGALPDAPPPAPAGVWEGPPVCLRPGELWGAAAGLLATEAPVRRLGWTARGRLASVVSASGDPALAWSRPVDAARAALDRVQLRPDEVSVLQVDAPTEALPLAVARGIGISPDRLNPDGDALSSGRAAGPAGLLELARLLGALEARDARFGLLVLAAEDGQSVAFLVDREFYL
jgi:hypothetical protein